VLPDVLDMLEPRIDKRHVLARLPPMGANMPADGTMLSATQQVA
jgi:hypothetical protein